VDEWFTQEVHARASQPNRTPPSSWLDRLFDAIESRCLIGVKGSTSTVFSDSFLPETKGTSYSFTTNRSDSFIVSYHTRAAVRAFLGFPCDHWSMAGAKIVQDLVSALGNGVLLFNVSWALMTQAPQSLCFQARSYELKSLSAVEKFMVEWDNQKSRHPLFTQKETSQKEVLYQLRLLTSDVVLDPSVVQPGENSSLQDLVSFYMNLLVLLPFQSFTSNGKHFPWKDGMRKVASGNLDFFLPFRQKAPTIVRACQIIFSDPGRLKGKIGLFNLLAFRAVFYGSPWARNALEWFSGQDAWKDIVIPGEFSEVAEEYFVNKKAYGTYMPQRSTELLPGLWAEADASAEQWDALLDSGSVTAMYEFMAGIKWVGRLTATLIVGDLVECGALSMPTAGEWGVFVERLNLGSAKGLAMVGFDSDVMVRERFRRADDYLRRNLSEEALELGGYDAMVVVVSSPGTPETYVVYEENTVYLMWIDVVERY
ncbi:hypothetical protein BDN72DRAFT_913232, partial [Pluteus cervinus]